MTCSESTFYHKDLTDACLEELADRIVAQQGSDLGFADSGSVSVALAALLDEQAASALSEWSDGDFGGAAMALHDAVNACGCGGHFAVMGAPTCSMEATWLRQLWRLRGLREPVSALRAKATCRRPPRRSSCWSGAGAAAAATAMVRKKEAD